MTFNLKPEKFTKIRKFVKFLLCFPRHNPFPSKCINETIQIQGHPRSDGFLNPTACKDSQN